MRASRKSAGAEATDAAITAPPSASPRRQLRLGPRWLRLLLAEPRAAVGVALLSAFVLFAVIGPLIWSGDPSVPDYTVRPQSPPSASHWLGTDQQGHDMFLQLVGGALPSLEVGFAVGLIATAIAVLVGLTSGYFGGSVVDDVLSLLTNVVLIIPGLPLVIVLAAWVHAKSNLPIILILGLTGWAGGARLLRSQALSVRNRDFVRAAVVRGERAPRVVLREILPNMLSIVISCFIGATIGAIGAAAGLQFLGLGNLTQVTWFSMLYWAQNDSALLTGAWWTFVPPGVAIALLVTSLAFVNFGIDAISNPRLSARSTVRRRKLRRVAGDDAKDLPLDGKATGDAEAGQPLVEISELRVDYLAEGTVVTAVDGVNLTLSRGEVLGLAGESGCGKSTLAAALMRLPRSPAIVSSGTVRFDGRDLATLESEELRQLRWRKVSIVSQSAMSALNPVRTVGGHFVDTLQAHEEISHRAALARGRELLEMVGVPRARIASYPHELSGGMRQRVCIALALALDPELLILDEPTTALDVVVQRSILEQIDELRHRLRFAVLFITHDLSLLVEFSDRIAIMYAGRLVEVAPSQELLETPLHPYSKGLVASFPDLAGSDTLQGVPGAPPSLVSPPPGCRFHPRCSAAMVSCRNFSPELLVAGDGRTVACHLYVDGANAEGPVSLAARSELMR